MLAMWIPKFISLLFLQSAIQCQEVQLVPAHFQLCPGGHQLELMNIRRVFSKILSLIAAGMPRVSRNTPVWNTLSWWLVVNGDERQLRTVTVPWHDKVMSLWHWFPSQDSPAGNPVCAPTALGKPWALWPQECSFLGPLLCPGITSGQFLPAAFLIFLIDTKTSLVRDRPDGFTKQHSRLWIKIVLN